MTKTICLDMDGTFVNFYGVDNWLDCLLKSDVTPYKIARPLVNLNTLARYLNRLQKKGYQINIISWLSKNGTKKYNEEVTEVKKKWLKKHLRSVVFDNISIVPYGTPKSTCGSGYLWDDEKKNRDEWENAGGIARNADTLIKDLQAML